MKRPAERDLVSSSREHLLERRKALVREVEGAASDLRILEEDREIETEEQAQRDALARLLEGLGDHERRELEEVQAALERIAQGTWGTCESCRQTIDAARLRASPEARRCLACEHAAEQRPASAPTRGTKGAASDMLPELRDLDDRELAQAVRERLQEVDDPDLAHVKVSCHDGVARLSGSIPSEPQRQVVLQIIGDGMGLEVVDRLRVAALDREDTGAPRPAGEPQPDEERIPSGRGMRPLAPERWSVPDDEGEPPETPPDTPVPEKE